MGHYTLTLAGVRAARRGLLPALFLVAAVAGFVAAVYPMRQPLRQADAQPWQAALDKALAGAGVVTLGPGPFFGRAPLPAPVRVTAGSAVRKLATALTLERRQTGAPCGCPPSLVLTFSGATPVRLALVHGRALRWSGGAWRGDALLTPAAAQRLQRLVVDLGLPLGEPQWDAR
jgi:hypothetical protein